MRALFALIYDTLASGVVELFPVWVGKEFDPPKGIIDVRRADLVPETFLLTRQFLYRITAR